MNKRIQTATIQGFAFSLIVFWLLTVFWVTYIRPHMEKISQQKEELDMINTELTNISKNGLSFWEFKSTYKKNADRQDPYVNNLLKNLDADFYEKNLTNTTDGNYDDFLDQKKQEVAEKKLNPEFRAAQEQTESILPQYTSYELGEGTLSDFDFTNYVESLLYTFNLQTDDTIWVGDILPYETNEASNDTKKQTLSADSNIYYIPLQLSITGQKKDVLDFLHYMEHVGAISIEDGKVVVYDDNSIQKPIEWEKLSNDYNIYEHQISQVESITMREYIDTSSEISSGDFVNFIKTTQWREKFTIDTEIRFYVAGLPDYKAEKYIDEVEQKYNNLDSAVKKSIAQNKKLSKDVESSDVLYAVSSINSLWLLLENVGGEIDELKKIFLKDKTKVWEVYEEFLLIDKQLTKAEKIYKNNEKVIQTIQ